MAHGRRFERPPQDIIPEPAPTEAAPPAPAAPAVRFEVFAAASGIRADQLAGFKSWVRQQKLGPRSMSEWRSTLADFQSKPVR